MRLTKSDSLKRHTGMLGISVYLVAGGVSNALANTDDKISKSTADSDALVLQ